MAATPACSTMAGEACCLTSTTPGTLCTRLSPHHQHHRPLLHLPSRPTSISLRKTLPLAPLVARTSAWVPQQGEKEVNVVVEEEDGWEKGYEEWQKGPESMVEGVEEEEEEGVVEEGGGFEAGVSEDVEEASYAEPPEEAKLFVGNLPYDIDSESLAKLFEEAGIVEIAEVIYNRETDQSRGFGFITMSTIKEADKAIEMFHRYDCNGRLLTVNRVAPRGSQPERPPRRFEPSSFRVYVGNLPWLVDATRLEQVFSEHGKVVDARVVYDRETGRSRGFGFVTMSTQEEVDDAIAALNGQGLDGRAIRVNVAEDRPRRGSFQFRQTDPY